jgi:hypothetical protein
MARDSHVSLFLCRFCVAKGVTPSKGRYANLYMNGKEVYKFATRKVSSRRFTLGTQGHCVVSCYPGVRSSQGS